MAQHKRKIKLIQPSLQLKLIGWFLGVAALALVMQFLLVTMAMSDLAADLPNDGRYLIESSTSRALLALGISFLVLMPLSLLVGVLVTFRIAGPIYRFEQHFKAIARGEDPGACRIRKDDELQEFCGHLNSALDTLRARGASTPASSGDVEAPSAPLPKSGELERAV
jgi:hypothetical protein